jgi:hypothetical protein
MIVRVVFHQARRRFNGVQRRTACLQDCPSGGNPHPAIAAANDDHVASLALYSF